MKNIFLFAFFLFCMLSISIKGQIISKTDTLDGNIVTYTMDARIDNDMEKLEDDCEKKTSKTTTHSAPNSKIYITNRKLTTEEVCRKSPKLSGFKIQLVIVKTNTESNEVKAYFRSKFPMIKAQTDASLRPNYKVLVGSYFSKESAAKELAQIRQYFKSAIIIPYNIYCVEAK